MDIEPLAIEDDAVIAVAGYPVGVRDDFGILSGTAYGVGSGAQVFVPLFVLCGIMRIADGEGEYQGTAARRASRLSWTYNIPQLPVKQSAENAQPLGL